MRLREILFSTEAVDFREANSPFYHPIKWQENTLPNIWGLKICLSSWISVLIGRQHFAFLDNRQGIAS